MAHGVFKDRKSGEREEEARKKHSAKRDHRGGATTRRDAHQAQDRISGWTDGYKFAHRSSGTGSA